jgi:bacteriorhodopsin
MEPKILQSTDVTGGTFLLALAGVAGSAVLLFLGSGWVAKKWKIPVSLVGIACLIATGYYVLASNIWLHSGQMPVIYRYIDWIITIPVQVVTLYFFIAVIAQPPLGIFWRLLVVAIIMVLFRYLGEVQIIDTTLGFLIGFAGWLYILGEVFFGRLNEINAKSGNGAVQTAFFWLRLIVTVGWAIYPLCNFVGSFAGGVEEGKLSVVYNLSDFINLIAFGLIVLTAAMQDSVSTR